jgi:hypothetical protein
MQFNRVEMYISAPLDVQFCHSLGYYLLEGEADYSDMKHFGTRNKLGFHGRFVTLPTSKIPELFSLP